MFSALAGGQKKKGKKGRKQQAPVDDVRGPDFNSIKKFTALKLAPPTSPDDYPTCKKSIEDLRAALVYWGKITQRQEKLKFIRESPKLMANDEYKAMAETEFAFLKQEKEKFLDEEAAK